MQRDVKAEPAPDASRTEGWSLATGMTLVIVGMQVFIIQPGFIGFLASTLRLSEAWAGYIASAEMFGIAFATIATAALGAQLPWRAAVAASSLILGAADIASIFAHTPLLFLVARAIAGLGSGVLISIGYSVVGMTRNADRNFGFVIMALLGYGAVVLFIIPAAGAAIGLGGMMHALAVMAMLPFGILSFLPAPAPMHALEATEHRDKRRDRRAENLALAAVAIFFLAQGMVWAYLALMGTAAGVSDQAVATGLALSQVSGVLGAFSMAWFSGRISKLTLLLAGAVGSVVPLLALLTHVSAISFGFSMIVFNGSANLMTPLLMAMAAAAGRGDARIVQRAAALQMLGLAAGPALAAPLADRGGFAPVLILSTILFVVGYWIARQDRKTGIEVYV